MDGGLQEDLHELLDPNPDIHALFQHYNQLYFDNELGACSVEWSSKRMTLCGGVCEYLPGGGCRIKLSQPLLSLRPSRDLKDVLLHEMIHARVMLTWGGDDVPDGHGSRFNALRHQINRSAVEDSQRPPGGYNITVHHTMFAEVDHYRQHHWRCERCGSVVKRSMNRRPQEADCRGRMGRGADCRDQRCSWHMHLRTCGGEFAKIKEPEMFGQKKKAAGKRADGSQVPAKRRKKEGRQEGRPITDFFPTRAPAQQQADSEALPSRTLPALAAVTEQAQQQQRATAPSKTHTAGKHGQQQQQPSLGERRRLAAEAALRRLQGSSQRLPGQQQINGANAVQEGSGMPGATEEQQQQQQQHEQVSPGQLEHQHDGGAGSSSAQQSEVIELISSDDEDWELQLHPDLNGRGAELQAGAADEASRASGQGAHLQKSSRPVASAASAEGTVSCPVCEKIWVAGSICNAQLNAHVDECLALTALAQ